MANDWIEPIWHRSFNDLERKRSLALKANNVGFENLTEQEQQEWFNSLIGSLRYVDLNRIENNTEYLLDVLNQYGYYFGPLLHKINWVRGDYVWEVDLERIRTNIERLLTNYYSQERPLPSTLNPPTFEAINDIEHILFLVKEKIQRMEDSFRKAGTFKAGSNKVVIHA